MNEWETEPDEVEFNYKGFNCLILRMPSRLGKGHLCGYVELPEKNDLPNNYDDININVHGGLTFMREQKSSTRKYGVCLGFDCAHSGDLCPQMREYSHNEKDLYKNIAYVRKECESICDQLIKGVKVRYDAYKTVKVKL